MMTCSKKLSARKIATALASALVVACTTGTDVTDSTPPLTGDAEGGAERSEGGEAPGVDDAGNTVVPAADDSSTDAVDSSVSVPDSSSDSGDAATCKVGEKLCGTGCTTAGAATGCDDPTCAPCSIDHGTAICAAGKCAIGACALGYSDCDGSNGNGCETQSGIDQGNCGTCAKKCSFANAGAQCSGGNCVLGICSSGWADCNTNSLDGCETNLSNAANCGGCSNKCGMGASCTGSTCRCPGVNNTSGNPVVQKCYDRLAGYCCASYTACLANTVCSSYLRNTWAGCINGGGGCCFGCGNTDPLWTAMRSCIGADPGFASSGACGSQN